MPSCPFAAARERRIFCSDPEFHRDDRVSSSSRSLRGGEFRQRTLPWASALLARHSRATVSCQHERLARERPRPNKHRHVRARCATFFFWRGSRCRGFLPAAPAIGTYAGLAQRGDDTPLLGSGRPGAPKRRAQVIYSGMPRATECHHEWRNRSCRGSSGPGLSGRGQSPWSNVGSLRLCAAEDYVPSIDFQTTGLEMIWHKNSRIRR